MLSTSLIREEGRPVGFQNIARDVTVERRMQENLRFYLERSAQAQEEERRRIARELHDDTMQVLYAISRQVDSYARDTANLGERDVQFLQDIQRQAKEALDGIRRFAQDLRPPMLDELGLLSAVRWLLSEVEARARLHTDLRVLGQERRLPPEAELTLFRFVQEGMLNAERHAHASHIRVTIEFQPTRTRVAVEDNGVGFEPPERVGMLGGALHILSQPGAGTSVAVEVPVPQEVRERSP